MRSRRILFIVLIAAAVLVLAAIALPFLIDANQFRPTAEANLTKSLGRVVKIGDLKVSVLSGTVTASDLSVADDPAFSTAPFLLAKVVTLSVDFGQLVFSRKLIVRGMTVEAPEAFLIQAPSGAWNFSTLGTQPPPLRQMSMAPDEKLTLSMKELKIDSARVSVTEGNGKPRIFDKVNMEVRDFEAASVFPFTLKAELAGGGDIALQGKAGPMDQVNAANTPLNTTVKIANWNVAASGAVPASSGIDGVVAMDGSATLSGQTLAFTGHVQADKLKLAPGGTAARDPLLLDIALTEGLKDRAVQISRGDLAIGSAKANLTGTVTEKGDAQVLNLIFSAPGVPVSGLVKLFPALGIVLPARSTLEGGSAAARLAITGPESAVTVSGPVSVQNTRLSNFDAGAKMSVLEKFAGLKTGPHTEVQTFSASLLVDAEGTSLRNIHAVLPSVGELTGSGTISPSHVLDFRMKATVRSGAIISTLALSDIPFSIVGTSSDPQFRPDVGKLATEEIGRTLQGVKVGGVDSGKAATTVLKGLFGGKKK